MWLFALMAHDGLSNVHPAYWGFPLVLSLFYLVGFTARACYKDFAELKRGLVAEEAGQPEEGAGQAEDGDGIDEPESAADGADASSPEDEAWASTEEDAGAAGAEAGAHKQEEDASQAGEQYPLDFAIDVMLCNYKDEADLYGKSAFAEGAPAPEPPAPEAEGAPPPEGGLLF